MKINISGEDVMVFRNENTETGKVTYRSTIGHKNTDGTFTNAGIQVRFQKGVELEDRTKINIKEAKLDHFEVGEGDDKKVIWYIFVFDFEIVG